MKHRLAKKAEVGYNRKIGQNFTSVYGACTPAQGPDGVSSPNWPGISHETLAGCHPPFVMIGYAAKQAKNAAPRGAAFCIKKWSVVMAAKNVIYPVAESTTLLPFLLEHVKGSRNNIKNLLAHGQAAVDGVITTQFDHPLAPGQSITVLAAPPAAIKLPFPVLFEDEQLIVINKPAGLLSIANDEEKIDTAYHHVTDHIRAKDPERRIFVVHRLDRDTSGVLLFAKNPEMKKALQEKWEQLVLHRGYVAITEGVPKDKEGTVRSFLRETKGHMVFSGRGTDGKEAVTNYKVRLSNSHYALLDVTIDTGRKNQIRVHMKDLGCPIAGDKKYDARTNPLRRLGLHASELRVRHPRTGIELAFLAPEPPSFRALCRR